MATTKVAVAPMKAVQIARPNGEFEVVEREIPRPEAGQVRIKVQACGVCHSDVLTKEGSWPGIQYPRVPGHEIAGIIDEPPPASPHGAKGSASGWAGMAVRTIPAHRAVAEIFATAST